MTKNIKLIENYEAYDVVVSALGIDTWCKDVFRCEELHDISLGKGIKVAVLDSGCPQHEDIIIADAVNFSTSNNSYDESGHSTHVCGILANHGEATLGIVPEAELYSVKVLDDSGCGSFAQINNGLTWCLENDIDIINLSLGAAHEPQDAKILCSTISELTNKDVIIVAAAGNSGQHQLNYPAHYGCVISVGSIDKDLKIESWSHKTPDFVAPSSAYSTWLDGGYARITGTSQSTAFISGLAATIKSYYKDREIIDACVFKVIVAPSCDRVANFRSCGFGLPQMDLSCLDDDAESMQE